MDETIQAVPAVSGFRFSGVASGVKRSGLDLGLVVADEAVATAGVFTRNQVRAAPVELAEERVRAGLARAILVNSGNANACTGKEGEHAAQTTTLALADALGVSVSEILPASTGVIGVQLPVDRILAATPELVARLNSEGASRFARAILTTDRGTKISSHHFGVGATKTTLVGMAKGAGMIHPNMATTLAFVVTDADITPSLLRRMLRQATDETFNRITVDGDTSTNDSIFVMASGLSRGPKIRVADNSGVQFRKQLTRVLGDLAKQIVADGEGAERCVRISVTGAANEKDGVKIARTVATSQLVKTAIHGRDPNWGRILAAMGRAGVVLDVNRIAIRIGSVTVFRNGKPIGENAEQPACDVMGMAEYTIHIRLGMGDAKAHYDTCDLGHEYVRINAEYRS